MPSLCDLGRDRRYGTLEVEVPTSLSMRMLTPSMSLVKGAEKDKLKPFPCGCDGAASAWKRLRVTMRAATNVRISNLRIIARVGN